MNKNEEKDLEIIVRWEEEKEIKTVEELDKFIDEKCLDLIKDRKLFILYKGYEIEYALNSQEYSCESIGIFKIYDLYEIMNKIDKKENNKSKNSQSIDMDRNL